MRGPKHVLLASLACLIVAAAPRPAAAGPDSGGVAVLVQGALTRPVSGLVSIFNTPRVDDADLVFDVAADAAVQDPPAQGGAPTPHAISADQSTVTFKPTKFLTVLRYSLQLTFYEHVMRVAAQDFTRQELGGPFFRDWFDSVHMPKKWGDLDSWQVNYLGHAIHGSAATRIWLDQREPKPTSKSQYLKSYGRAFLFTIVFSEQYEIGPMSEASIGNVGLREGRTGWVDHIWTPIGGVLWAMAEDAIDKYFLAFVDEHVPFVMARAAARMILNPGRMLANVGQNRTPWSRPDRPLTAGIR
jgi:hypothetical protein